MTESPQSDPATPTDANNPAINPTTIVVWLAQVFAVGVLIMAALTKLIGGASELAAELPGGMAAVIVIGALEAITALLLLLPKFAAFGALLAAGLMVGALAAHATVLGWSGDLGGMWMLAVAVLVASAIILVIRRDHIIPG